MELIYLALGKSFQENISAAGGLFYAENILTLLVVCDVIFWCSSWLSLIPRESVEVSFSLLFAMMCILNKRKHKYRRDCHQFKVLHKWLNLITKRQPANGFSGIHKIP